ncbi:hypothetical protein EDB86DRAFT_3083384 [Lactarius hatsudake]|nr:hypothetical protein EDB86DRAFT_3083384 [Lactarius hatsudake]
MRHAFRADFVRQKHVPAPSKRITAPSQRSLATVGALPLEEKRVWEVKAKHAKAEHKQMYPNYRFRPVHNKNKERKPKALSLPKTRSAVKMLPTLLEGMKGEELAAAVKRLDRIVPNPLHLPRRPPQFPFPTPFPFLSLLYLSWSLRGRRPLTCSLANRSWNEPFSIPREPSPMPEINASLFNGSYLDNAFPGSGTQLDASFDFGSMFSSLPGGVNSQQELFISPLDSISNSCDSSAAAFLHAFTHLHSATPPVPPSTYSGSPAPSDFSLPVQAPKPQRAFDASHSQSVQTSQAKGNMVNLDMDMSAYSQGLASFGIPLDMGLSYVVPEMPPLSFDISEQLFADAIQEHQQQQQHAQQQQMPIVAPIAMPVDTGFNFNDVINDS